jgi:REP element-mobilizing transposase RayT
MSTGYQIKTQQNLHFITFTIVDWVDVFVRKSYRDVLINTLNFYIDKRGLQVFGYVIMSNHMHAILYQPSGSLSDTIRDLKKYSANKILELIKAEPERRREWMLHRFSWNATLRANVSNYQVWKHDNHAEEIWSWKFFNQKLNYIHQNPVRAGLVDMPQHWLYSSAADQVRTEPLVKISEWEYNGNQEIAIHQDLVGRLSRTGTPPIIVNSLLAETGM